MNTKYLESLTNPFSWIVNLLTNQSIFRAPNVNSTAFERIEISELPETIESSTDWNILSNSKLAEITGLYSSLRAYENHSNTLNQVLESRLSEVRKRIKTVSSILQASKTITDFGGESVTIKPELPQHIDFSPELYKEWPRLNITATDFRLNDTGVHSLIRSSGLIFVLSRSNLDFITKSGNIRNVTDGLKSTFWSASARTKDLIKLTPEIESWIPSTNNEGGFALLSLYLLRPSLFSDLTISPVSKTIQVIRGVRWIPPQISNFFTDSNLATGSEWTLTNAVFSATGGVNNSSCLVASSTGTPAYIQFSSPVSSLFTASTSNFVGINANYLSDKRLIIQTELKSTGGAADIEIEWVDASSNIIAIESKSYIIGEDFVNIKIESFKPANAASVNVKIGAIKDRGSYVVTIDNVKGFCGDKEYYFTKALISDESLLLPIRDSAIQVDVILQQPNPIKVNNFLEYEIGLTEIDINYREHVPRGALISKPVAINSEIREFLITLESSNPEALSNSKCVLYPDGTISNPISVTPFKTTNDIFEPTGVSIIPGERFEVITSEELEEGLFSHPSEGLNRVLIDPNIRKDVFDGTSREGSIVLEFPIHFRKVRYNKVKGFLRDYAISNRYDPNRKTLVGVTDATILSSLKEGNLVSIPSDKIQISEGYSPLKVTVKTPSFTALPDIFGSSNFSQIQYIENEQITLVEDKTSTVTSASSSIDYEQWLNVFTVSDLFSYKLVTSYSDIPFSAFSEPFISLRKALDTSSTKDEARLRSMFQKLKENNQLPNNINTVTQKTESSSSALTYKTKFANIVTTTTGVLITLKDGASNIIDASKYSVDSKTGIIKLKQQITGTITASYAYINLEDDRRSDIDSSILLGINAENQYRTRNLTDYESGKIPVLKPFDPNPLSLTYYPIIEYYHTTDNRIIFSREFFKYGDRPATIEVEYESLMIKPRIGLFALRSTTATSTPIVDSITLVWKRAPSGIRT